MTWAATRAAAMAATLGTFGGAVYLHPPEGPAVQVSPAMFDAAHEAVELEAGVPVSSVRPVLWVEDAKLPADIREGYTVEPVPGAGPADMTGTFRIYDVQPAGAGYSQLVLHRE